MSDNKTIKDWSVLDVRKWLESVELLDLCDHFQGKCFVTVTLLKLCYITFTYRRNGKD